MPRFIQLLVEIIRFEHVLNFVHVVAALNAASHFGLLVGRHLLQQFDRLCPEIKVFLRLLFRSRRVGQFHPFALARLFTQRHQLNSP